MIFLPLCFHLNRPRCSAQLTSFTYNMGIWFLTLICLTLYLTPNLTNAQAPTDQPPITNTITVDRIANVVSPVIYEYPAEVVATEYADLSAEVTGRIQTLPVELGDRIEQGDTIASLDCEILSFERQAIEAQQRAQEANNEWSRKQLNRLAALQSRAASSQSQIDEVSATIQAGEAQMALLEANLARLDVNLDRCDIKAPFSGLVTDVYASIGQFVNTGTPIIKLLSSESQEVELALRATLIELIEQAADIEFVFLDQRYPVSIKTIVPNIASMANAQIIRLQSNDPARLLNGAQGQIRWQAGRALPAQYLHRREGEQGIYLYQPNQTTSSSTGESDFTFYPLTNIQEGRSVILPEQIKNEDQLLVVGAQHLSDQSPIMVVEAMQ